MEVKELDLSGLCSEYKDFLRDNLSGHDISTIAVKIRKSERTIYTYISKDGEPKDYLTMRAIVEEGLEILKSRNILHS